MTISVPILDLPSALQFQRATFYAGAQIVEAGITTGGILTGFAEPGGRAYLRAQIVPSRSRNEAWASWLMTMASKRSVFKIQLFNSPQLVRPEELGLTPPDGAYCGIRWDNGQPFDNGLGWFYEPRADVAASALEGNSTVSINMSLFSMRPLLYGKVIGLLGRAYHIDDIAYDDDVATLTISPPLRRAAAVGDVATFRPTMLGVVQNPDALREMYGKRKVSVGEVTFAEALL